MWESLSCYEQHSGCQLSAHIVEAAVNIDSFKSMLSDVDSSRKENRRVWKVISAWRWFIWEWDGLYLKKSVYPSKQTPSKRNPSSKLMARADGHKGTFGGVGNVLFLDCSGDYVAVYICEDIKSYKLNWMHLSYANYTSWSWIEEKKCTQRDCPHTQKDFFSLLWAKVKKFQNTYFKICLSFNSEIPLR